MTAPIEQQYRDTLNGLAHGIDIILDGDGQRKVVFALLIAEAGWGDGARVNYISTAERSDMLSMMREFIARAEGAFPATGGRA